MEFALLKKTVEDVRQENFVDTRDVAKALSLRLLEAYRIMEEHKEVLGLKRCYQIYCSPCQHSGPIYPTYKSIPRPLLCDQCGQEKDPFTATMAVYTY